MEQGVHGLCRHDTVFRELFVALRLPVDGKGLQIALAVGAVLLDEMKDLFCVGQRNGVFGQPVVSGKGIDGKALIVGVLGGVLRLAGVIAAPVHAAVCLVVAVFQEELVGVAGIFGKVWPGRSAWPPRRRTTECGCSGCSPFRLFYPASGQNPCSRKSRRFPRPAAFSRRE